MTPIIPGLIGKKMSASDPRTKIDLLDSVEEVNSKLKGAHCVAGEVEDNGVLALLKHVIMVIRQDKGEKFVIERPEKYGGNLEYDNYDSVEKDFVVKKLHPLDLINGVAKEINNLLAVFQKKKDILEKVANKGY